MAPVNWANSDEDIEANLNWIEERHQVSGRPYNKCPNRYCSREWHGVQWSKAQPAGQRVEDKIQFCIEFLRQYAPDQLVLELEVNSGN